MAVAQIGGQLGQMGFHVLIGAVPVHEGADAEAVTQVMDAGAVMVSGLP